MKTAKVYCKNADFSDMSKGETLALKSVILLVHKSTFQWKLAITIPMLDNSESCLTNSVAI